ncbi:MAG TPA: hypothetical protein VIY48_21850 [Candidatus Paceibacterota bacterium]
MTMFRGAFSNNLAPGFRKVVFMSYKERPLEGSRLVNMQTSNRAYLEDFNMAGFGTLLQKPEGSKTVMRDILPGNIKRYTFSTYSLGFRITREMLEDDLYGIFGNKFSRGLGVSARNNFEVVAASPFNNAFDTTVNGYVAGEALVSTSHALLGGGTASNRPASDVDFSLVALQAAIEHFHNLTNEEGLPMLLTPKWVVHGPGNIWAVNQVLKSQFLPGGSQNDINYVAQLNLQPFLSHYITDPDAWFVLADETDINYFDRVPPTFSNTDDFMTDDALFKVRRRNGAGFGGWRGVYGSPGI